MDAPASFSRRSSPAFAVGGLGYEPESGVRSDFGRTFEPYGGWVCYHCGERFTHWLSAERHFGKTPDQVPACISAAFEVVAAFREWRAHSEKPLSERLSRALFRVDVLRRHRNRSKRVD